MHVGFTPRKRTCAVQKLMSALGQKRTSPRVCAIRIALSATAKVINECPQRHANIARRVLLHVVDAFDGNLALIGPCAAIVAGSSGDQSARHRVDEELWNGRPGQPLGIML